MGEEGVSGLSVPEFPEDLGAFVTLSSGEGAPLFCLVGDGDLLSLPGGGEASDWSGEPGGSSGGKVFG